MKRWTDAALVLLREEIAQLRFPFHTQGAASARLLADSLIKRLDDHILPRAGDLGAPLLAVVGGSTGSGKSALVNALATRLVSASTVMRPTTRRPLLLHHSNDFSAFNSDRILPSLARIIVDKEAPVSPIDPHGSWTSLELRSCDELPAGVAILDAPDIDSMVEGNRKLAKELLSGADMWIFVTTAARYGDALPWEFLLQGAKEGITIAVVLNRVTPSATLQIREHLQVLLAQAGLEKAPLFVIGEQPQAVTSLPEADIVPLRTWLAGITEDDITRQAVAKQALLGAIKQTISGANELHHQHQKQLQILREAKSTLATAKSEAMNGLEKMIADGTMLRGEVLMRWQEVVGTNQIFRTLERKVSRLRDRISAFLTGKPAPADEVAVAIESQLNDVLTAQLRKCYESVITRWDDQRELNDISAQLKSFDLVSCRTEVEVQVRQWQRAMLDRIRTFGAGKRTAARILAVGVNLLGVALMIVVFSMTGGITTAEVGIAGATAVLAQRLLEAVFGDQAVRKMAIEARNDLLQRMEMLLTKELSTIDVQLPQLAESELLTKIRSVEAVWGEK